MCVGREGLCLCVSVCVCICVSVCLPVWACVCVCVCVLGEKQLITNYRWIMWDPEFQKTDVRVCRFLSLWAISEFP